ncbi:unnamed protein product [Sympodiomycopsis kandeliae]
MDISRFLDHLRSFGTSHTQIMATAATTLPLPPSLAKIETYLLLAKSARGVAAAKLVVEATGAPGCYVFAELMDSDGVRELLQDPSQAPSKNLLELFQLGTLSTYLASPSSYPRLSQDHIKKLRQLTLVSAASQSRILHYDELLQHLALNVYIDQSGSLQQDGIGSSGSSSGSSATARDPILVRALEDVIIEAMSAGLLSGKLDQRSRKFHVDSVIGRDVGGDDELKKIEDDLSGWNDTASKVLSELQQRIDGARQESHAREDEKSRYDDSLAHTLLSIKQEQSSQQRSGSTKNSTDGRGPSYQAPVGSSRGPGGGGSFDEAMDLDSPDENGGSPSNKKKPKRSRS